MSYVDDIADKLAQDTMKVMTRTGDDQLYDEVAKTIAASSTTLEEAYLTAIRVRLAAARGRRLLETRLKAAQSQAPSAES